MKRVVPAAQALPRATGSITIFRVFLTILHQKDDTQDSPSDPTCPPAAVSAVGSQQKFGVHPCGCSNSHLKLQKMLHHHPCQEAWF